MNKNTLSIFIYDSVFVSEIMVIEAIGVMILINLASKSSLWHGLHLQKALYMLIREEDLFDEG
jgi:hypothetical protein